MKQPSRLYFIALLPPIAIQEEVTQIKQYFAQNYNSRAALSSPPHITLQPPFQWLVPERPKLEQSLSQFAAMQGPIPITLSGFSAFPPRVIYVDVLKTPELMQVQGELAVHLETTLALVNKRKQYPFVPHMTVASRDLKRQAFKAAWLEFEERSFHYEFSAKHLTLLLHDGKRWNVSAELSFMEI